MFLSDVRAGVPGPGGARVGRGRREPVITEGEEWRTRSSCRPGAEFAVLPARRVSPATGAVPEVIRDLDARLGARAGVGAESMAGEARAPEVGEARPVEWGVTPGGAGDRGERALPGHRPPLVSPWSVRFRTVSGPVAAGELRTYGCFMNS
ncbi:hypothetical protein GCM10027160_07800 [Streptomyces calidiresistens]